MCPLPCACISTHAPLAGRDPGLARSILFLHISTHAPLAGRDVIKEIGDRAAKAFQPTRPLRGATTGFFGVIHFIDNFNPRAPCGARRGVVQWSHVTLYFNPRAPCGARHIQIQSKTLHKRFQPTRPLRGATPSVTGCHKFFYISTHAPLAGRDQARARKQAVSSHFNPRAPCGARPSAASTAAESCRFQPTRPLRGATGSLRRRAERLLFQPTRPLRGATVSKAA